MNSNDFLTVEQMLFQITDQTQDKDFRKGFSKGWYLSQIEYAMSELAYNTFYAKKVCDIKFDTDKMAVKIPDGMFNIRELYLFTPDCDGAFTTSVKVYNKRLFNNNGKGASYTANVRSGGDIVNNSDPYYETYIPTDSETLYVYAIQNGMIMLSSNCSTHTYLRIIANWTGVDKIGDDMRIPRMFREYIEAYVCSKYFSAMKAKDRAYRTDWNDWMQMLALKTPEAKTRAKSMNTVEREDLKVVMGGLGINGLY